MSTSSLSDYHQAIVSLHGEIREEGGEFDFRYSLVDHLFTDALGWSRTEGEGHVNFEDDRKDVLCYDDSDPPFPVVVSETKRPSHELNLDDTAQLETYLNGVGSAKYGVLTNGRTFQLYDYNPDERSVSAVDGFDIEDVATTELDDLSSEQRDALAELDKLHQDRYVEFGDADTFRETYQEVPVHYQRGTDDEGYELFLDAITQSLDELTDILKEFFDDYHDRPEGSYPRNFLETTFPDWQEWREYTGTSGNAKDVFCRETAYIVLNRALFARIAEDKEIVSHTRLSSRGMADELERDDPHPYLDALMDTYDRIDDHYPDLYELGIFDWWWVGQDKRGQFDRDETRRQRNLEDRLNYALSTVLKRLNRFDFEHVNRDILGHVYEDYLPKRERKELGEYYTPLEVAQFMLDSVEYRPSETIGRKQVLDPACGSGTFLTEVAERLIQHFIRKFGKASVHQLDPDEARTVLERVEENVYGIDINPFAVHITQINLLFRTIDLYDKVTEKDPHYAIEGFEVHVADTLSPTTRERRQGDGDSAGEQMNLQQFEDYNGRARAFLEDRNAVDRIKDEEEFDVVVANPPYVQSDNIGGMRDTYYSNFSEAVIDRNFDLFVPFIERGLRWLAEDGKITYICQNRLMSASYAENIRNRLVNEPIEYLLDFREADVFDVPAPYPCIFSIDRTLETDQNQVQCARFASESVDSLDTIYHLDEWRTPSDTTEYDLFHVPQSQLRQDGHDSALSSWRLMPDQEREVYKSIAEQAETRISDIRDEVFEGLITGRDKIFTGKVIEEADEDEISTELRQEEQYVWFEPDGSDKDDIADKAVVEKSALRRILKGEDIEQWRVDWRGTWSLFPYQIEQGESRLLAYEELETDYPGMHAYLSDHKEQLESRTGANEWWAYTRPRPSTMYQPNKIMTRVMAQEPSFVPDPESEYCFVGGGTAGGYGILLDEDYASTSDDLILFSTIFNSQSTEYFIKQTSSIFNDKHYSHNQRFLDPVPIKVPDGDLREELLSHGKDIKSASDEIADLRYKSSDITNYSINYDDASTILDLAQMMDLTDDDYRQDPIRTDTTEVDSETTYQVVLKRGHAIDFEDERTRDFVYKYLIARDKRLSRSEILNMDIPSREDVFEIMSEYQSDIDHIEELERETKQLQTDLNELIFQSIYELDDDEVAVIDDFLAVW